jgi:uncharacterized membrane protein
VSIWYHLHGAFTHFPIALALVSFAFDLAGAVLRRPSFRTVGFWTLLVAAATAVAAVATGLIVSREWSAGSMLTHRNTAFVAGGLLVVLALWRGLKRDELTGWNFTAYLVAVAAAAAAVGFTGWLGGNVVMGS